MAHTKCNGRGGFTRFRRYLAPLALGASATLAFGGGIYVQRRASASQTRTSPAVQLAQASQDRGASSIAGSHRRKSKVSLASDNDAPAATLDTVYSLVKEHYVDALPDDSEMSHGALRSLLSALHDPQVYFLTPNQRAIVENEGRGHFSGIGAALNVRPISVNGYTEHKIEVVSVLPGSPADQAGLRPHDMITRIDGKWVLGSDPFLKVDTLVARLQAENKDSDTDEVERETSEARRRANGGIGLVRAQMALRGDSAELEMYHLATDFLKLTIVSPNAPTPRIVDVALRETDANPPSVSTRPDGLTLIKIPAFTDSTLASLLRALGKTPAAPAGIVLDLRANSGGTGNESVALQEAQKIAGLLCPSGINAKSEFAFEQIAGSRTQTLRASKAAEDKASACSVAPMLVLVDNGTAGAAEALAASLADAGRAKIMGRQTFGRAGVQSVYDLQDGSGFVLATGKLSSSKHYDWEGRGITPSVLLPTGFTDAEIMARAQELLSDKSLVAEAPRLRQ